MDYLLAINATAGFAAATVFAISTAWATRHRAIPIAVLSATTSLVYLYLGTAYALRIAGILSDDVLGPTLLRPIVTLVTGLPSLIVFRLLRKLVRREVADARIAHELKRGPR